MAIPHLKNLREQFNKPKNNSQYPKKESVSHLLWRPTKLGKNTVRVFIPRLDENGDYIDQRYNMEDYPAIIQREWVTEQGFLPYQGKKLSALPQSEDPINKYRMSLYIDAKSMSPKDAEEVKLIAKKLKDLDRYYLLVLDRDDDTQTPKFWEISKERFGKVLSALEKDELQRAKNHFKKLLLKNSVVKISDETEDAINEDFDDKAIETIETVYELYQIYVKKLKFPKDFVHTLDEFEEGYYNRFDLQDGTDLIITTQEEEFTDPRTREKKIGKSIVEIEFSNKQRRPVFDSDKELENFWKKVPSFYDDLYLEPSVEKLEEVLEIFIARQKKEVEISSKPKQQVSKPKFEDDEDEEEEFKPAPKKSAPIPKPSMRKAFVADEEDDEEDLPFD